MLDQRKPTNPASIEVLEICDRGTYPCDGQTVSIADAQRNSEDNTRLYTPDELRVLRETPPITGTHTAEISVVDETTQQAAKRLSQSGAVVLLNFASARNPGGGFLGGAVAQEEDICRCSGLYRTLLTKPNYYLENRANPSCLYTDATIYSPRVPFFRLTAKSDFARPFFPSVITAPAPNAGALKRGEFEHLEATFDRRWQNVLAVAEDNQQTRLILGAWGCGAFQNDPTLAARTALNTLQSDRFRNAFEEIVFAIPNQGKRGAANFETFRAVFKQR